MRRERILIAACLLASATALHAQQLMINEIQVANIDQWIDPSYNYGGWVELYNPSAEDIGLAGYVLRHTDADGLSTTHTLTYEHGVVPARGFRVVWFDHNSKDGYYGPYASAQIPFKLDADGGLLELAQPNQRLVDAVAYPQSIARCAYIRKTDGGDAWGWTSQATPGETNEGSATAQERLPMPTIDTHGGPFTDAYQFAVTIPAQAKLYYTTDGSTPEVDRSLESKDGRFKGSETTIYRFMLAQEGYLNSPVATRSFIKQDTAYSLPVLCVNSDPDNFFDDTIGLYVKGTNGRVANNSKVKANQNMDWERPVNVEYFVPNAQDGYEHALNQEAAFSIFGGWTRFNPGFGDFENRSSFKLKSSKVFEEINTFGYPLFGSKPYIKTKNFLVRNGGQDSRARIWDAAIHELLRTSGVYIDCQAWQPAHVFLNGKYLGMMNLREESNKQFAYSNYGIDKDEIDQWENDVVMKEGDKEMMNKWFDLSYKLVDNPNDTTTWREISDIVDIDEYCNYMAAEIYMGNLDWLRGGLKNIKGFRAKDDKAKFHIVLHDVDGGFGDTNMILQIMTKGSGSLPRRFINMLRYAPFKKQFIDAYCLMNGSVFHPERCCPIVRDMLAVVEPALALENETAKAKADLLCERLADSVDRRPALKQSLMMAFGLQADYAVKLSTNLGQARLLLNGQEVPTSWFDGYLFAPIRLACAAPDGYRFVGWTVDGERVSTDTTFALSEGYEPGAYTVQAVYEKRDEADRSTLCINEVSAGNDIYINDYGKKADWLEVYNRSDEEVDLAGWYLSNDERVPRKYRIGDEAGVSTLVPAHGHKVIWCDAKSSISQIHAPFKLKNDDQAVVVLTSADGAWADKVCYKRQPRWGTYGRYPDGGNNLALMERPTIETTNHWCTSMVVDKKDVGTGIAPQPKAQGEVAHLRYYNLVGQEITAPNPDAIVVQVVTYKNGTRVARKIRWRQ